MYDVPILTLDVPGSRSAGLQPGPGHPDFENDRRYVRAQLDELIPVLERISGVPFDIDLLRENMAHANAMSRGWARVLEVNRAVPAPFNALTDGTIYLGVANCLRGTPEGARYFDELVEEMEYKRDNGIGTQTDELYRLLFVGVPCYPIFRRFGEMFAEWGGTFVHSTYLWFASGGTHAGYQYDLKDPMASLAEGLLLNVRAAMDSMFFQTDALLGMFEDYQADGVIYHPIKSCRTVSTGLADARRALMARGDVPSLFIESDMMDRRVVSEAQLKNRIDAFFEGLAARKAQAVQAAHAASAAPAGRAPDGVD
jgi:benzoyl-CoA reductase subunit B